MAIFGNNIVYSSPAYGTYPFIDGHILCGVFKMGTVGGTGNTIVAYIYNETDSDITVKAAIYDSNKVLVTNGTTNAITLSAYTAAAWQTFTFASAPTLTANAIYYLVVWGG